MVITFKSRAASDILMFGETARQLLSILGKDPDAPQGIVTVEQLPGAILQLKAAIDADRSRDRERQQQPEDDSDDDPTPTGMAAPVSLHQRGWPLLEMLEASRAETVPVTWGT